jgi:hypothetical protein
MSKSIYQFNACRLGGGNNDEAYGPQNKASQTRLSHGTLVEQALPRKIVHEQPIVSGGSWEWHEWAISASLAYRW